MGVTGYKYGAGRKMGWTSFGQLETGVKWERIIMQILVFRTLSQKSAILGLTVGQSLALTYCAIPPPTWLDSSHQSS